MFYYIDSEGIFVKAMKRISSKAVPINSQARRSHAFDAGIFSLDCERWSLATSRDAVDAANLGAMVLLFVSG